MNEAKLPKWARQELDRLRMRLNEANATIATLRGREDTSPVIVGAYAEEPPEYRPVNHGLTLAKPGDKPYLDGIRAELDRNSWVHGKKVRMKVTALQANGLVVVPVVSNVVLIEERAL